MGNELANLLGSAGSQVSEFAGKGVVGKIRGD